MKRIKHCIYCGREVLGHHATCCPRCARLSPYTLNKRLYERMKQAFKEASKDGDQS